VHALVSLDAKWLAVAVLDAATGLVGQDGPVMEICEEAHFLLHHGDLLRRAGLRSSEEGIHLGLVCAWLLLLDNFVSSWLGVMKLCRRCEGGIDLFAALSLSGEPYRGIGGIMMR
jgi:hypothetical protein